MSDSTLPLFPGTFKTIASRPDGRRPAILTYAYHCPCGRIFSRFRWALGWLRCPHCGVDRWFGVELA